MVAMVSLTSRHPTVKNGAGLVAVCGREIAQR
jgi:hypothetical protein